MSISIDEEQRRVIKHSLGLDWSSMPYRNHFAAGAGHVDYLAIVRCVHAGLMEQWYTDANGMEYFRVTEAGAEAVGTSLVKIPY